MLSGDPFSFSERKFKLVENRGNVVNLVAIKPPYCWLISCSYSPPRPVTTTSQHEDQKISFQNMCSFFQKEEKEQGKKTKTQQLSNIKTKTKTEITHEGKIKL